MGETVAAGQTRWAARAEQLRSHPLRRDPISDADWSSFKEDMKTVREGVLDA